MSTRGEDDSRPSRPIVSQRPTARDVPIAKYNKEVSSAPRGLRGQSLLPGQGAPERIAPEDIEFAVIRQADTLDGPNLARAAANQKPELTSSPPPTAVSVEVPRVRSAPPALEPYVVTPTTPSARSIQSGTLMSVGSVDPRAPTELSLPSPRSLSQSERAAYFGPEAVVDRTPVSALPSAPQALAVPGRALDLPEDRQNLPHFEPFSSARGVPVGSGAPASSARRSHQADSPAPPAAHFARAPRSYAPVSVTRAEPAASPRVSQPPSVTDGPRFEIHSELDAVPHEPAQDDFDLRRVSTQREPLAGRKPMPSADWSHVHEPVSAGRDSALPSERTSQKPSSSSAITLLVDRGQHVVRSARDSRPSGLPAAPERAPLPLSWVLGAAAFALILALLVAWVMRAPAPPAAARASDERAQPGAAHALQPPAEALSPAAKAPAGSLSPEAAPLAAAALASPSAPRPVPGVSAPRSGETPASSLATARAMPGPSARGSDLRAAPSPPETAAKARQSIY